MLRYPLILVDRDRESFRNALSEGQNSGKLVQKSQVICYIDSTWVEDYLVQVESVDSPCWNWMSPDRRPDTGYFIVRTTLHDLLNNLTY